jgi:phosphatidylglycerophosphate synthase
MGINQRIGAAIASAALKKNLSPTQLSVSNALVGIGTGALVVVLGSGLVGALAAFIGWQFAYSLDCSDGQLARASGKASPEGIVIDAVCDFLTQSALMVAVLWLVDASLADGLDPALSAGLFAVWIIAPYYAGASREVERDEPPPLLSVRGAIRQFRDYGFHLFVIAVLIAVQPEWLIYEVAVVGGLNLLLLARVLGKSLMAR